jgi:cobalamin biosynthesis protein CobD/CbiB
VKEETVDKLIAAAYWVIIGALAGVFVFTRCAPA